MSIQLHVAGPLEIYYGGETSGDLLGQGDGDMGLTIRELQPVTEVRTDAAGGEPEDYVQRQKRALVIARFIKWDPALLFEIRGWLKDNAGTPALCANGEAGTVGMLMFEDSPLTPGSTQSLVIKPTKKTALGGGMKKYTFNKAILDPNSDLEISNIGSRHAMMAATFIAHPNDSGIIWAEASVT